MSSRIASQHLASAFDNRLRELWRAMHRARRENSAHRAVLIESHLVALLEVRKIARRDFVSAPNPSTLAFRQEQAAHEEYRDDREREYMADQYRGLRQGGLIGN